MTKHLVLPDVQAKEGMDCTFLTNIGRYAVEKKPDTIICLGDFADMASLSTYDVGKRSFEGKRYVKDIEAAKNAMSCFMAPFLEFNAKAKKNKEKLYKPKFILTLGNHEHRILRAIDNDPKLDGVLSIDDLGYASAGWEVFPFLDVVVVDGIAYSHYFTSGLLGRPVTSAAACLSKKHQSCIMGHVQTRQIAYATRADGKQMTAIFAGTCNMHDEEYLGPQGNSFWRGFWMLHEVHDGSFDEMPVSLAYVNKKYD